MSKALVISNVDFSANRLDHVSFIEGIPCTGISLNTSTANITTLGGTVTLTPTVLPSNTTDEIVWSSSDYNKADVQDGVVTSKGVGTVTITATCGNYTASCVFTLTHTLTTFDHILSCYPDKYSPYSGGHSIVAFNTSASHADEATAYSLTQPYDGAMKCTTGTPIKYGLLIPYGASTITFDTGDVNLKNIALLSTKVAAGGQLTAIGKCYSKITGSVVDSSTVVTLPAATGEYEGMDSFVACLETTDGTAITDADLVGITMTFA